MPALAAALAVVACGLEYIPYINPPVQDNPIFTTFYFHSPANPGVYFRGYEVYYKLYVANDTALPSEVGLATLDALKTAGFHRLAREDEIDPEPPLIYVPQGSRDVSHTITITFPALGDQPYVTTPWDAEHLLLRRGIRYPYRDDPLQTGYQSFAEFSEDDYSLTPTDLTPGVWADIRIAAPVKLALFVLSYGSELGRPYYSESISLYTIEYTVGIGP